MAFILVICLVLCDADITAFTSSAENNADDKKYVDCTIQCMVETTDKVISDLQVKLKNSAGDEVKLESDSYQLETGEKYEYCITGGKIIDINGSFTIEQEAAGSYEKIIYIPFENLKYSFKDKSCSVGKTISMADDWDFDWEWSSSKADVATVSDTGEVTGVGTGSTVITREYKTIKQTATVTVDYKKTKCKLNFYYKQPSAVIDVDAVIKGEDNISVSVQEDGTYELLSGKEYTYKICTKGLHTTDGKDEGTFEVPDDDEAVIDIEIDFIEPVFKIEETDLADIQGLKSNETVKLLCTNFNELYKSDDVYWKYAFNSKNYEKLSSQELELEYEKTFGLKCKCGDKEADYSKNTFDSYTLKTIYIPSVQTDEAQGIEITKNVKYFIGNEEKDGSDLEVGKEYTIIVDAEGFEKKENKVTTSLFEQEITLQPGSVKNPVVEIGKDNKLSGYSGAVIEISEVIISDYSDKLDWQWICVKEDDSDGVSKKLKVQMTGDEIRINLQGAEAGTYQLKYQYGDAASAPITITVEKIQIDIDWSAVPAQSKNYDATNKFKIALPVSEDAVLFKDVEKNPSLIGKDDKILITGCVEAKDVGRYESFTITDIKAPDRYDVSGINKQEKKIANGLQISQITQGVTFQQLYLQYRINEAAENSWVSFSKEVDNLEELKKELFQKMNVGENVDYKAGNCTFKGVQYDKNLAYIGTDKDNVRFEFPGLKTFENQNILFSFEIVPEYIKLNEDEIYTIFQITQEERILRSKDWCNDKPITASFIEGAKYSQDGEYNAIHFYEADPNLGQVYEGDTDDIETNPEILTEDINEETYYEVLFLNTDYPSSATVVAYIRIIPESEKENAEEENNEKPETISVNNKEYPVIRLYLDKTAPKVDFVDERLTVEAPLIRMDGIAKSKIDFNLKNTGFPVSQIEYCFVNKTESVQNNTAIYKNKFICDIKKQVESGLCTLEPIKVNGDKEHVYTIDCPEKEGDYIIVFKVANEGGMEAYYCSNGFAVDTTPPDIDVTFIEIEREEDIISIENESGRDVTSEILDENKVFRRNPLKMDIDLTEAHIEEVTVKVAATDKGGKSLFEVKVSDYVNALMNTTYDEDTGLITSNATIPFAEDANYNVEITAKDKAGNKRVKNYVFTVDKTKPDSGSIEVAGTYNSITSDGSKKKGIVKLVQTPLKEMWNEFVTKVIYGVFSKDTIQYTMSGSDKISPEEIRYYLSAEYMTEGDLNNLLEESWHLYDKTENNIIEVNKSCFIYERVMDKAGNISYFSTEGMITDNHKPDIALSLNKEANKNGFYNGDVSFSADIEDKIPEGGTASSGLQYVVYYLERDGKIVDSSVNSVYDNEKKEKEKDTLKIEKKRISAKEFNSNDVTLCVTAIDNAGNKNTEEIPLKIDNVKPEISVSYDDQAEGEYCNHTRTATISIKERNLNTDDVKIVAKGVHGNTGKVGKWSHSGNTGKSDNAVYTCKVTFTEDDDYEFTVSCVDKAGNKAAKNFSDKFTVDATKPIISVSYNGTAPEQNAYYKEPITATITITEHNFNASKVDIQMHADNSSASGVSGFSSNGDVHTATVSYSADGTYGLDVAYTDEAGNAADSYSGSTFTVDLIEPEIEITNIQDKSANKGDVKPVIICTDVNYDSDKAVIKLYGANNGEIDLKDVAISSQAINNGEQFTLDFPETQILDDVYTLTAEVTDKAGNETEKSIEFSVNRFGSVYTLGTETGEWLTSGVCSYIQEGRSVVIVETNVDEVVERNIAYTQGGVNAAVVTVNEAGSSSSQERENGTYYQMKDRRGEGQWYQYEYTISADNFLSEGRYSVQIDSTDKAGNHTSNVSNKRTEGNLVVEFAVDQTAPSAVITGAENREVYNEASHTVYLDVQDNLATDYVTVYLNGEKYGTYKASDIEELENGLIPVKVGQSLSTQTIQLMAKDMAGNVLSEKSEGKYGKTFDDFHIIVTTNPLVRFLHTTWFWLLLLMILVICGISVFIIIKRKKMQVENQSDV